MTKFALPAGNTIVPYIEPVVLTNQTYLARATAEYVCQLIKANAHEIEVPKQVDTPLYFDSHYQPIDLSAVAMPHTLKVEYCRVRLGWQYMTQREFESLVETTQGHTRNFIVLLALTDINHYLIAPLEA